MIVPLKPTRSSVNDEIDRLSWHVNNKILFPVKKKTLQLTIYPFQRQPIPTQKWSCTTCRMRPAGSYTSTYDHCYSSPTMSKHNPFCRNSSKNLVKPHYTSSCACTRPTSTSISSLRRFRPLRHRKKESRKVLFPAPPAAARFITFTRGKPGALNGVLGPPAGSTTRTERATNGGRNSVLLAQRVTTHWKGLDIR